MSALISQQASFSHNILSNVSPFQSEIPDSDLPPSDDRAQQRQVYKSEDNRGQNISTRAGNSSSSEIKLGSLSSTVEEPTAPPEPGAMTSSYPRSSSDPQLTDQDATDDASHPDPDTARSHSSSSSSESSYYSDSLVDAIEARNHRFPPVLPSTIQPRSFTTSKYAVRLLNPLNRSHLVNLSADGSSSSINESSSEGEDEESAGQEEDDAEEDPDEDEDEEEHDQRRRVQALWAKLCEQRDLVKQLRLELSSKRKHLRELRGRKNEADNRFMSMLRPYLLAENVVPASSDMIIRQFESMQQENDEYHGEETEVEQLEADLDEEELCRERLELEFFTFLYGPSDGRGQQEALPPGPNVENYRPSSRASLSGIPAERPVDIHPLYTQLLDAVGDQELAKEHHGDLLIYRDSILYDLQLTIRRAQLRDTEGRPDNLGPLPNNDDLELVAALAENPSRLDELQPRYRAKIGREEEEFLRQFPKEEAMLREKLTEAKNEVDRLRQLCIEKGAMRKNAPYHEEYTIFSNTGEPVPSETMSINQEQTPRREEALANSRFPILLSNPRHVLEHEPLTPRGALRAATRLPNDDPNRPHLVAEAMKEYGISTLVVESASENKSDYINRWLLHRLRTSPLEVEHLYSVFTAKLKVRNTRRWQEDVLYFWSRDDANKPLEEYIASVTTRDALVIDDDTVSDLLNSSLGNSDRSGSDPVDRPESSPRPLHIAS